MTSQEHGTPGALWELVQQWLDSIAYPPSQRKLAGRLGVSASAVTDWKYGRGFPSPANLDKLSREIGVPYERALDAVLRDHGYRRAESNHNAS